MQVDRISAAAPARSERKPRVTLYCVMWMVVALVVDIALPVFMAFNSDQPTCAARYARLSVGETMVCRGVPMTRRPEG